MKIYKVCVEDGFEKYFAKEEKAIEYGLKCLDKVINAEWERMDACDAYEVDSWDEARMLILDDGEDGVWVKEVEVIE